MQKQGKLAGRIHRSVTASTKMTGTKKHIRMSKKNSTPLRQPKVRHTHTHNISRSLLSTNSQLTKISFLSFARARANSDDVHCLPVLMPFSPPSSHSIFVRPLPSSPGKSRCRNSVNPRLLVCVAGPIGLDASYWSPPPSPPIFDGRFPS